MKTVLVIAYGSIGKRHVETLLSLGIQPIVLSKYPDNNSGVKFINHISEIATCDYTIIASPTARHYFDLKKVLLNTDCRKILIEKPLDSTIEKAQLIKELGEKYHAEIYVAYNMRFFNALNKVKKYISDNKDKIRIVEMIGGQYLPEWRPGRDYKQSYSASQELGGGVELDLSHEIDYMCWLFGEPKNIEFKKAYKISKLEINSHDIFKGIYQYDTFLVHITLDYIRKKERKLRIHGENELLIEVDFINKKMQIEKQEISSDKLVDVEKCYQDELKEFLEFTDKNRLCTINEGLMVLEHIL